MIKDNEAVYDEKIAPLMRQIIAVCKEHQIPFAAQFQTGSVVVTMAAPSPWSSSMGSVRRLNV